MSNKYMDLISGPEMRMPLVTIMELESKNADRGITYSDLKVVHMKLDAILLRLNTPWYRRLWAWMRSVVTKEN